MATIKHIPGVVQTLTWTNTGAATDVVPDTDTAIDIGYAETVAVQVDLTHASNTSNNWDTKVLTSVDGTNYDTVAYATDSAAADATIHTFLVNPGPRYMKLRGNQNTGVATGYVTARILIVG